jgi:hypothetical protein
MVEGELSASSLGHFTPWERVPGTHWAQNRTGRRKKDKNLAPTRTWTPIPRPTSCYTDSVITAPGEERHCPFNIGTIIHPKKEFSQIVPHVLSALPSSASVLSIPIGCTRYSGIRRRAPARMVVEWWNWRCLLTALVPSAVRILSTTRL